MSRLPRLIRAIPAAVGGLLLAGALAAPAPADELQSAPTPFELQDIGEDLCTYFDTAGLAAWPSTTDPGAGAAVDIAGEGWISHAPPEAVCLSVDPSPRHIEFTAYTDHKPVGLHSEPFDRIDEGGPFERFSYDFSFTSPQDAPIDYVTVAICRTLPDEEVECGEPAVVEPNGMGPGATL